MVPWDGGRRISQRMKLAGLRQIAAEKSIRRSYSFCLFYFLFSIFYFAFVCLLEEEEGKIENRK
jgi:hypothetical protein